MFNSCNPISVKLDLHGISWIAKPRAVPRDISVLSFAGSRCQDVLLISWDDIE